MKGLLGSVVSSLLLISVAADAAEKHPLIGTWKRIAARSGPDAEWQQLPENVVSLKHITGSHFTFLAYEKNSKLLGSAFGGKISIDGDNYIEQVDYGPQQMLDLLGSEKQHFKWKIEDNVFTQSGTLSNGIYIGEQWQRVPEESKAKADGE